MRVQIAAAVRDRDASGRQKYTWMCGRPRMPRPEKDGDQETRLPLAAVDSYAVEAKSVTVARKLREDAKQK